MQKRLILPLLIIVAFILISGCVQPQYCGDGICNGNETNATCPTDCASQIGYGFLNVDVTNSNTQMPIEAATVAAWDNPLGDGIIPDGAVPYTTQITNSSGKAMLRLESDKNYAIGVIAEGYKTDAFYRVVKLQRDETKAIYFGLTPIIKSDFNFYTNPADNHGIIMEVPIIDGVLKLDLIYGTGDVFNRLGKSIEEGLVISNTQRLWFSFREYDSNYKDTSFIVGKITNFNTIAGESHYLGATINDENKVTIVNKVTNKVACSNLKINDVCKVGNVDINVANIEVNYYRSRALFILEDSSGLENGSRFNSIHTPSGQWLQIIYDVYNSHTQATFTVAKPLVNNNLAQYLAYWENGVAKVSCSGSC